MYLTNCGSGYILPFSVCKFTPFVPSDYILLTVLQFTDDLLLSVLKQLLIGGACELQTIVKMDVGNACCS